MAGARVSLVRIGCCLPRRSRVAEPELWPFPGARRERDPAGLGAGGGERLRPGTPGSCGGAGALSGWLSPKRKRCSPDRWRLEIQDEPGWRDRAPETWPNALGSRSPRSGAKGWGPCTEVFPPVALLVESMESQRRCRGDAASPLRGLLMHLGYLSATPRSEGVTALVGLLCDQLPTRSLPRSRHSGPGARLALPFNSATNEAF